MGAVEEERSRYQEAIEAYESVLALEPDHLSAIMRLGVLYGQANESEKTESVPCRLTRNTQVPGMVWGLFMPVKIATS
ncbi:MAG: tetratricopeptide repeat protein [Planctomycetota bacterium]